MLAIAHNLSALNAQRQFNIVDTKKGKTTEKLSSGYRVNRAADDAAGLAISEKMRRQIRGLTQASANCQEGIGLCQVKDGALNEVHEILNRMNELSVQSANGTLMDEDRSHIQAEMDELVAEINQIARNTTYNEIQIFDYANQMGLNEKRSAIGTGYLTDVFQEGSAYHPSANLNFNGIDPTTVSQMYGKSFTFTCSQSCPETFKFTFINGDGTQNSVVGQNNGSGLHEYTIDIHGETTAKGVLDKLFNYVHDNMPNSYTPAGDGDLLVSHSNRLVRTSDSSFSIVSDATFNNANDAAHAFDDRIASNSPFSKADCSELAAVVEEAEFIPVLGIQAGCEAGQYIYLTMRQMNAKILGIDPTDISTQSAASESIGKVKYAQNLISEHRSKAGAEQNRLEHAIYNLDNVVENTTAAESRIRDTDMAKEMMSLSLSNILAQAGQSVLAQANQSIQGVLSLLS